MKQKQLFNALSILISLSVAIAFVAATVTVGPETSFYYDNGTSFTHPGTYDNISKIDNHWYFNNVEYPPASPAPTPTPPPSSVTTPVTKLVHSYGDVLTAPDLTYLSNFDYIVTDGADVYGYLDRAYDVSTIHTQSSDTKILAYHVLFEESQSYNDWATVNANENWFLHDAGGNRIYDLTWNYLVMNLSSSGYVNYLINWINTQTGTYGFDGVYFDVVYDTWAGSYNATVPASYVSGWHSLVTSTLTAIKAGVGSDLIVINTEAGWAAGHINYDYVTQVDGSEIEGYFHASWTDTSDTSKIALSSIDYLAYASNLGKIIFAGSGCTTNNSRIVSLTYSAYLLGAKNSTSPWGWNTGPNYLFDADTLQSIMYTDIGTSTGNYYADQFVLMRNFNSGLVLNNPASIPHAISLTGYHFLNGSAATSFTMEAYSGEVLYSDAAPTPTPTTIPTIPPPEPTLPPTNPLAGEFIIQTVQDYNLDYGSNSGFNVQDVNQNITVNFVVTSGSLQGLGNLNVTSSGGIFMISPSTSGLLQVTSDNSDFVVTVNGAPITGNTIPFTVGTTYLILWQYISHTNPGPVIIGTRNSVLYFRSDSYTSNNVTANGLDITNTNAEQNLTDTITTESVIYGFRVWVVHASGTRLELTSGAPDIQIARTADGSGWQNTTWTPALTPLTLGKDSLEVTAYISLDNGASWTAKANYITHPLLTVAILHQTWTFNIYTTRDTTAGYTRFSFGSRTFNSNINGVGMQPPTQTEINTWRFLTGDYIGFLIGAYVGQIGIAAYLLVLLIPTATLYVRHRHFGPVVLLFVLFGGPGGIIWLFIPAWAAAGVDILLILGCSFIVWRLIR